MNDGLTDLKKFNDI